MKKIYATLFFITFYLQTFSQLTGMSPNQSLVGIYNLSTTITSNNLFVVMATQWGNLNKIYLYQGPTSINLFDAQQFNFNTTVTHPDTCVVTNFNIPSGSPTGLYNLVVITQDVFGAITSTDTLSSAYTVLAPDGNFQGNIYEDENLNGQRDINEHGINNATAGIDQPSSGQQQYYPTDINGDYSVPALNGNYTVDWKSGAEAYFLSTDSNTYTVTMNSSNITGLDFGLYRGLTAMAPTQSVAGRTVNFTVTSRNLFHGAGSGNIWYCRLGSGLQTGANAVHVIDSSTATFTIVIPANATPGTRDLMVAMMNGQGGPHYLRQCFTILPYDATISGNFYFDANNNGVKDTLESKIQNEKVSIVPDSGWAFSNSNGDYSIGILYGNHTVAWVPNAQHNFILSSDSASYTVNATGNVTDLDFGLRTTNPDYTCSFTMTHGFPRCNNLTYYTLHYTNLSNTPFNGQVYFVKDPVASFYTTYLPATGFNGDTAYWNLSNIQPFGSSSVSVWVTLPNSGAIYSNAGFIAMDNFGVPQNTSLASLTQVIGCSFDPNDKSVTPEGIGPEHYTLKSDWLEYLVRFQNTGTDTAFNVTIYDQLSNDLDLNTFELLASSHPVITEVENNGEARFVFANILLPDSNVDELNSHGFIKYRIKAKSTTYDYTDIMNTAFIVFDSNAAVVTNTTQNMMVTLLPVGIREAVKSSGQSIVYPNPFTSAALLAFDNPLHKVFTIEVRDMLGNIARSEKTNTDEYIIRRNNLSSGVYVYRIIDKDKNILSAGKFVIN